MIRRKKMGFTLVELSIVMVIIGILIAGVLIARSMIESAKVSKIISDINNYQIISDQFYTKYRCLPGDCRSNIVGASYSTGWAGNNRIDYFFEQHVVRGQLKALGHIETSDNLSGCQALGVHNATKNCFTLGSIENSFIIPKYASTCGATTCDMGYGPNMPAVDYKLNDHYLLYGGTDNIADATRGYKPAAIFTTQMALAIDTKSDDGLINSGTTKALGYTGSCANNLWLIDTPYNPALTGNRCVMAFKYNLIP